MSRILVQNGRVIDPSQSLDRVTNLLIEDGHIAAYVELTVDGETLELTARVASDEEKAEMWPRIVEAYKGYAGYQKKTDRNIPVVVCEPRSA